jgi:hypothetical protein
MKTQISKLLSELYALDPELAKKEPELTKILTEMLTQKPDTRFDENFRAQLRQKLSAEIVKSKPVARAGIDWKGILAGFLAGGSAIALASYLLLPSIVPTSGPIVPTSGPIVPVSAPVVQSTPEKAGEKAPVLAVNSIDFGFSAEKISKAAFGSISHVSGGDKNATMSSERSVSPSATSSSISSNMMRKEPPLSNSVPIPSTPEGSPKMMGDSRPEMMPPYLQKVYSYTYAGTGYAFKDTQLSVLQKKKNTMSAVETDAFLKNFNVSSIDLAQFSKLKINNITLAETQEYGMSLYIDFVEGTIGLSKNWNLWPQAKCTEGKCQTTQIGEMPSDEKSIEIAQKFVKTYGISTASYGKPIVNSEWRAQYEIAADKDYAYVPDSVSVIFPLGIDGKDVYEEYGQAKGMTVNIDVKTGRVTDVFGMEKLDFASSDYAVESDFSKILDMASKGGRNGYSYPVGDSETPDVVKIPLGEPELIYEHLYDYQDGNGVEYLVPALKFPVMQAPKDGEYFQKTVIVPVIAEFFTNQNGPILYRNEMPQ